MLEDKLLVLKLRQGSPDALRRIYEKYKNDLLALAVALSNNRNVAEDVVCDVFVSFAQAAGKLQLRTSLKSYLTTCIANRIRSLSKDKQQHSVSLDEAGSLSSSSPGPDDLAISAEQNKKISDAIDALPYQQREVILLHLHAGLKFRTIAEMLDVSINTVQSRYRYGLDKLRLQLDSEVEK